MDSSTAAILAGTGASLIGNLISASASGKMTDAQLAEQRRQVAAQLGIDEAKLDELIRQHANDQVLTVAQQTPNRVAWRQNQAVQAAIMPGLRNASVKSNIPGMNGFIPKVSGGLRIPEGGFGPDTLKFFGDKAMLAGESDLDRAGAVATEGRLQTPDYGSVYGQAGTDATASVNAVSKSVADDAEARAKARRDQLNTAMSGALSGAPLPSTKKSGGSSWWKTLLTLGLGSLGGGGDIKGLGGLFRPDRKPVNGGDEEI